MIAKRILANIVDFICLFAVFVISLQILTVLQKLLGLYENDHWFATTVKWILNIVILVALFFFFLGIIHTQLKGSIGKLLLNIKVKPLRGVLTPIRLFIRDLILKFIPMFITFFVILYSILKLLGFSSDYTNTLLSAPYIIITVLFILLNIASLILIGHPLNDVLMKTKVVVKNNKI